MRINILIALAAVILYSCSGGAPVQTLSGVKDSSNVRRFPQSLFVDGSIHEIKGEYNEAINLYLEALKYDSKPGIYYAIAKNYFRLNKLAQAVQFSRKAVEKDSSNIEFLTLHAAVYGASHLEDSAETIYHKILKLDSANVTAYYNLAQISEPKKPSLALKYYKKILTLVGPEWNVLVKIADINERLGNVEETITTVEALLALNPSELPLQKLLIESYMKTKKFDKALKLIDEAKLSFPDDPNLSELKGNIFIQQGRWNNACREYLNLVKSPEISIDNKMRIGTAFYLQGEKDSTTYDCAEQIFSAINKDTTDWQINAYLGEIALKKGNDSLAVKYFKTASKNAEWNSQVYVRLGGLLFDSKKYTDAISYLGKAYEKFPNDFGVNLIYGLSLSAENRHADAKEALQRALNLNPDDLTVLGALGYTLNQLKDDDAALLVLNKALKLDPKNLQVLSIAAMIHESRKEYSVSDSLYTTAIKMDSANVLILNNYAYSLADRGINLKEALSMAKKAIAAEPKNSSYLDTIGWIYFRLGDYKKAKVNIEQAIKEESKNATLADHLGDVYFKLGDKQKAKELWKKAFQLDSTKIEIKKKFEKGEL